MSPHQSPPVILIALCEDSESFKVPNLETRSFTPVLVCEKKNRVPPLLQPNEFPTDVLPMFREGSWKRVCVDGVNKAPRVTGREERRVDRQVDGSVDGQTGVCTYINVH